SYRNGEFRVGTPSTAHQTYEITSKTNKDFTIVEVGGRQEVRGVMEQYLEFVHAIIFVIDGSDLSNLSSIETEFGRVLNHSQSVGKPLAIVFHKVDISRAHPSTVIDRLNILNRYDRQHRVFSTTAKIPHSFEAVLAWIEECLTGDQFPIQDKASRLITINILDMLENKRGGLPLLAILGQLEIISRTGQIEYNRDKIIDILRRLRASGELAFIESRELWGITDKGLKRLEDPELIKGTKLEKLRAVLDDKEEGKTEEEKLRKEKEQKEVLDEFDLDELVDLYKQTSKKK
ncbi:MAG: ADP-ribosylation factor-like protein, partial [Candidatus Hodarchaeales archaeon]